MSIEELLKDFVFVSKMKIEWGDMDAFEHVNNIEYFKYFQITRINYFNNIKSDHYMKDMSLSSILASTEAKYIYPLKYPDTISIGARVYKIAKQHLYMQYCIVSNKNKRVAAVGRAKIVIFDYYKNTKTDLPNIMRKKIIAFEKTAVEMIN